MTTRRVPAGVIYYRETFFKERHTNTLYLIREGGFNGVLIVFIQNVFRDIL